MTFYSKHRAHIAQVAALTLKHIETIHTNECNNRNKTYDVDLIVWPELAVHEEDLDILVQLSQKTHAIIFAGLSFINQPAVKGPNNCAIWIVPRKHNTSGNELIRYQGKKNMTPEEKKLGIKSWRPYQLMLELRHPKFKNAKGFMLSGTICYDATDIKLSTDLSNKSNALLISALNKDVNTFDTMVEALHYHMYQHIILVNSGEYGGSYAMGPYKNHYDRLITHTRGKNQVSISTFEMNMFDFRRDRVGNSKGLTSDLEKKTPPAGH